MGGSGVGFVVSTHAAYHRRAASSCRARGEEDARGSSEKEPKKVGLWTFVFGEKGEFDRDLRALGSSRRRFLRGVVLSATIALGGNLFGTTSAVLSVFPGPSRSLRLDQLYPVKGFKRFVAQGAFEFIYPQEWLEDQAVAYFESTSKVKPLDYSMQRVKVMAKDRLAYSPRSPPPSSDTLTGAFRPRNLERPHQASCGVWAAARWTKGKRVRDTELAHAGLHFERYAWLAGGRCKKVVEQLHSTRGKWSDGEAYCRPTETLRRLL
mmetsp:Transcript_488/g.1686  ORF Transcript_488/g.1686 Transcript_488/m.1686 type:complete len:265 (+) Transcript_488:196-990(+)